MAMNNQYHQLNTNAQPQIEQSDEESEEEEVIKEEIIYNVPAPSFQSGSAFSSYSRQTTFSNEGQGVSKNSIFHGSSIGQTENSANQRGNTHSKMISNDPTQSKSTGTSIPQRLNIAARSNSNQSTFSTEEQSDSGEEVNVYHSSSSLRTEDPANRKGNINYSQFSYDPPQYKSKSTARHSQRNASPFSVQSTFSTLEQSDSGEEVNVYHSSPSIRTEDPDQRKQKKNYSQIPNDPQQYKTKSTAIPKQRSLATYSTEEGSENEEMNLYHGSSTVPIQDPTKIGRKHNRKPNSINPTYNISNNPARHNQRSSVVSPFSGHTTFSLDQQNREVMNTTLRSTSIRTFDPSSKRIVKIWANDQNYPKFDWAGFCNGFLQKQVVDDVIEDRNAAVIYVIFHTNEDAKQFENLQHQLGFISFCELISEEEINFEKDMISVHDENLDHNQVEGIIRQTGYMCTNMINDEESRSLVLLLNTRTLKELFNVLNEVSRFVFCAPVKLNCVQLHYDKYTLNIKDVLTVAESLLQRLNINDYKIFRGLEIVIYTPKRNCVQKLMSIKEMQCYNQTIVIKPYYGCLTAEAYSLYINNYVKPYASKVHSFSSPSYNLPHASAHVHMDPVWNNQAHSFQQMSNFQNAPPVTYNNPQHQQNQQNVRYLDLSTHDMAVFIKSKHMDQLQIKHANVKLSIDEKNSKVILSGDDSILDLIMQSIQFYLRENFAEFEINDTEFSKEEIEVMSIQGFNEKINQEFDHRGKFAYFSSSDKGLLITYKKESLEKQYILKLIKETLTTDTIHLDTLQILKYQSKQWQQYYSDQKKKEQYLKYTVIKVHEANNILWLVGTLQSCKGMKDVMKDFETTSACNKVNLSFDAKTIVYAQRYLKKRVKEIQENIKELGAHAVWRNTSVVVEGLRDGVDFGSTEVTKLMSEINVKAYILNFSCSFEFLNSKNGQEILHKCEEAHQCLLEASPSHNVLEHTSQEIIHSEEFVKTGHIGKFEIFIMLNNPNDLRVGFYLNFINEEHLKKQIIPQGFIGGKKVWNSKVKELIKGQCSVTTSEEKEDVFIANVICSNEEKSLLRCFKEGFTKIIENCPKAVAISLESFENFRLDYTQTLKTLKRAITDVDQFEKHRHLPKIYMCCRNRTKAEVTADSLFDPIKGKNKTGILNQKTNFTVSQNVTISKPKSSILKTVQKPQPANSIASNTIKLKSIDIKVEYGDILCEKSDVLVTSIQADLDMSQGMVISEVLKKGGQVIQDELKKNYPSGIKPGNFAVSSAGQLCQKALFHCTLPTWNPQTSGNIVKNLIISMLEEMEKNKYTSISIPALGTGNLNYDAEITSKSILEGIDRHANMNPTTSVKNIKLVIFKLNKDIFDTYQKTLSQHIQGGAKSTTQQSSPLYSTLNCSSFGNVQVKVINGDITKQKTDAVVVPADKSLDLSKGIVASTILKTGGKVIQDELKKMYPKGLKDYNFARCINGNLSCKTLYFTCLPHYTDTDLETVKNMLIEILSEAESSQYSSLSLPCIGTGNLAYPAMESKRIIVEAIKKFSKTNPKYLHDIYIVVHHSDAGSLQEYAKGLKIESTLTHFFNYIGFGKSNEPKTTENATYQHGNVTLTLKLGDLTQESCDAIMCSVSENMDFQNSGLLCKKVVDMCGSEFVKECKKKGNDMRQRGFIAMPYKNWKLKCLQLFLLNLNRYDHCWDVGVYEILEKADEMGLTTIALPLFGAGYDDNVINDIRTVIHTFGMSNPKNLKDVILSLYTKDIYNKIENLCRAPLASEVLSTGVQIEIVYTNQDCEKKAMDSLTCDLERFHIDNTQTSHSIKEFTGAQIYRLRKVGNKCMVSVKVNKNTVNMSGFGKLAKVQNEISRIEAEVKNNILNRICTSNRFQWQYELKGELVDFIPELNLQLETEYKDLKNTTMITMEDVEYTVDFKNLTITNKDSNENMNLKRRDVLADGEPLPDNWERMGDEEAFRLVKIDEDSDEFKEVEDYFKKNGAAGTVVKIQRVQNRSLYQQYAAKKRELVKRNPGIENEKKLFHGSTHKTIDDINKTGFNRSYCGVNGTWYGYGVYFAQSSKYSESFTDEDSNNHRKLYLVNVLVGKSVETNKDTKFLPKQPGLDIPYDSGKAPPDRLEGIYVIFHDSQAYPEYIITFSLQAAPAEV